MRAFRAIPSPSRQPQRAIDRADDDDQPGRAAENQRDMAALHIVKQWRAVGRYDSSLRTIAAPSASALSFAKAS
jgi:hypothetical protein